MKKIIKFKTTDDQIQLFCEDIEFIAIPKNNLTIDGKELFDNFISKLDLSTIVEFDYVENDSIDDTNEKRIIADIKTILNNIAQKINDKFKLFTKDLNIVPEDEHVNTVDSDDSSK